jgi:MFS family permease
LNALSFHSQIASFIYPGSPLAMSHASVNHKRLWAVLAGAAIMSMALGSRQTFGLFISPLSYDHGLPVTLVAFAIALHNLVWGAAQPLAGAMTDRHGPAPVVAFGAVCYAIGLALTALAPNGAWLVLGMGVFIGVGISCTSFGVVLPAVGRSVPPERRSSAMGLVSAGGSLGQVLMLPLVMLPVTANAVNVPTDVMLPCAAVVTVPAVVAVVAEVAEVAVPAAVA